jgi:UDP-2-acetamido-2-deoxy-ribo-hexuluronate aminotransferase
MIELVDLRAQYEANKAAIDQRIQAVLAHGRFIMGPEVAELEERLEALTGAHHCVTVSSGTEALLIAMMALGITSGDEVVTTPFIFIAPVEAAVRLGARPVFCDVEPDTGLLDATLLEAQLTRRTKAIVPVSLYGQPCDMDAINALAERHGLSVIEDAAQSFGGSYRGRASGVLCTFGCTSFFPTKPLGCYGDGGALFTASAELARAAREIRVHGQSARYQHGRVGTNGRMDTLQCAVVLAKLERFTWEMARRRQLAARYDDLLTGLSAKPLRVAPGRESAFAQYTVLVDEREAVARSMRDAGVATTIHYPALISEQQPYLDRDATARLPRAQSLTARVLSLPLHPFLTDGDQRTIARALRAALKDAGSG